jgi:hypothetical protein
MQSFIEESREGVGPPKSCERGGLGAYPVVKKAFIAIICSKERVT